MILDKQLDDLHAYGRQNLEIHNIPITGNEDTEALALKATNIKVAHHIGNETDENGKKKKSRSIIIRFF